MLKTSPRLLVRLALLVAGAQPLPAQAQVAFPPAAAAPSAAPPQFLLDSWSREVELKQRLAAVNADIRSLRREDNATASPYPGLAVSLAGAGVGIATAVPLVYWGFFNSMSHSSEEITPSRAMLTTFGVGQITGAALALGGVIALNVRLRQQPNRARVKLLDAEGRELRRELKLERKQRRYLERLEPDASVSAHGGGTFGVRYSFD